MIMFSPLHFVTCHFQVFKLGVTQDTDYRTPNLDYMTMRSRQVWLAERAFIALFMAAHRGHIKMVEKLIAAGKLLSFGIEYIQSVRQSCTHRVAVQMLFL
jgi:hypothetical protein